MNMQIICFPYLSMGEIDEIDFGLGKIWNFSKKSESYIQDESLRASIKSLLELNVGRTGQPIRNIGILSIGSIDFRILTKKEMALAGEIRMLMLISGLAKNIGIYRGPNTGHHIMTSENFNMVVQNFKDDSDFVGESSGVIVRKMNMDERENMKFYAPTHIPFPDLSYSNQILRALLRLRRHKKSVYNRILNSVDLFSWSYYNSSDVSIQSRILMQTSAFEVLLDLPQGNQQRKCFKEKIEHYLVRPRERKIRYKYETFWNQRNNCFEFESESKPLKVLWADRFYCLRNKIIHGTKFNQKMFYFREQPHYLIGTLFYFLLIKEIINESFGKRIFFDGIYLDEVDTGSIKYRGFRYDDQEHVSDILPKIDPLGESIRYCK